MNDRRSALLDSVVDFLARLAPAALVAAPLAGVAAAAFDIHRQQWMGQGLGSLALQRLADNAVLFSLVAFTTLLVLAAVARATSPRPCPPLVRAAAAAFSCATFAAGARWALGPAFRYALARQDDLSNVTDRVSLALLAAGESTLAATALWGLLAWAAWRLQRGGRERRVVPFLLRPRRRALLAALPLLGLAALARVAAPSPPASAPSVVLVVVDTLRADHLGAYGYRARPVSPRLDAFAAEAVLYERAISPAPWTTPSVAALLTSRHPRRLGFRSLPVALDAPEVTMAEVLAARGWRTHAVVSNLFASSAVGLAQGFEAMDESNLSDHLAVSSAGVTDSALAWLRANRDAPFFLYVHYFDPHYAYRMHAAFDWTGDYRGPMQEPVSHVEFSKRTKTMTPADLEYLVAAYDSEIAWTDAEVGRLFDGLRELGVMDRATVVFTADHGEEFDDRGTGFVGHEETVRPELVHVPLLVRAPGGAGGGRRVGDPVSTLDVAPTLLGAAGASFPAGLAIDGRPLGAADADRTIFAETMRGANLLAVQRGGWKAVFDRARSSSALYDVLADPGDRQDVGAGHPEILARLDAERRAFEEVLGDPGKAGVSFSAGDSERLRALGYAQ